MFKRLPYGKLFDTLREAHESGTDIRAVVIPSALPKLFTAGLDLTSASSLGSTAADTSQDAARASLSMRGVLLEFQHAIGAPERCAFPVIVAVHGPVVGLGVDLISACDIRYAASNAAFSIKVRVSQALVGSLGRDGDDQTTTDTATLYICAQTSASTPPAPNEGDLGTSFWCPRHGGVPYTEHRTSESFPAPAATHHAAAVLARRSGRPRLIGGERHDA